jgi:hypothetical protein
MMMILRRRKLVAEKIIFIKYIRTLFYLKEFFLFISYFSID